MVSYLLVIGGLALLLGGGDLLVRGAISLAKRLRLSPLLIGLTVVAFGTSAPELVVSIDAALKGVPEIAIGNVVGSNIANVLLVLGLAALVFPIVSDEKSIRRDGVILIVVSISFIALAFTGTIYAWQGAIMVALLASYLIWSYISARNNGPQSPESLVEELEGIDARPLTTTSSVSFILFGIAGLAVGSDLLVGGAVQVAKAAGLSDATIGLTLVALGTSLPELATAMVAALRRHGDVALGNVIGSNLFNILGIMGITAMIVPVPVPVSFLYFDLWVLLLAALLIGLFLFHPIGAIRRPAGVLLCLAYGAYIWSLLSGVSALSSVAVGRIAF
jgi:cation:H+ antiporter